MNYIRLLKMAVKDVIKDEGPSMGRVELLQVLERAEEINIKFVGPCKKKVSH